MVQAISRGPSAAFPPLNLQASLSNLSAPDVQALVSQLAAIVQAAQNNSQQTAPNVQES